MGRRKRLKLRASIRKAKQYSITVITKTGKMLGTPWFDKLSQAKRYIKNKLRELGYALRDLDKITLFIWRAGDTLETMLKKELKEL